MDDSYILRNGAEIASPALLFFLDGIRANLDRATELAGDPERLRPHVKTHKCPNLVREQMRRGINKFKCAVLQEARMLAECGAPDVLLAYPLTLGVRWLEQRRRWAT